MKDKQSLVARNNPFVMNKDKEYTSYKQKLQPLILSTAKQMFSEHGIRAVKMDEIASKLAISKRTLYEIYANKEDLICAVIAMRHEHNERVSAELMKHFDNCIDVLIGVLRLEFSEAVECNPLFFTDMLKYPKATKLLEALHDKQHERAMIFFSRGVKEGYFMQGVNYNVFHKILATSMSHIFSDTELNKLSLQEIFAGYVSVLLRGFCTIKGLPKVDEFIEKEALVLRPESIEVK